MPTQDNATQKTLDEIRHKIDATDDDMLKLFLKRMQLVSDVAGIKKSSEMPVLNKTREREILKRIREEAGDKERYANSVWNTLLSVSRAYQDTLLNLPSKIGAEIERAKKNPAEVFPQAGTIACQGVEGGYSQMAADRMFPRGNLVYFETFEAVFDAVKSGLCNFGILPIENSSNGSVRAVYDLIQKKGTYIVRSERLFVRHVLLAKPGTRLEDIKEIRSHEQALGQCSNFLSTLDASVKIVPVANTAQAVQDVANSDESGVAAIASFVSGELYGLTPVKTEIQNSENNYTRFICIAKDPAIYPGANRISLILTCKHQPGSLYEILGKFAALGINLLKLESYPIPGHDFDFMFFFDISASVLEDGIQQMLGNLEESTESLVFLGNYLEI